MRIIQNTKAISTLFLILLLIASAIIGALLSYLWVVGYYESLSIRIPEAPTVTISNVTFDAQNTSFFNITLLHPSYSPLDYADINKIAVSTHDSVLYNVTQVDPSLPWSVHKADQQHTGLETFECIWDWANYTGETIEISVSVEKGSGATRKFETPVVDLRITDVLFNSTISISHFNMTVKNSASSITYVNITRIAANTENVAVLVPPTLPYALHSNDSVSFMCSWNWADYQGKNVTISVETLQGYVAYYPEPPKRTTLPPPVIIKITDVLFDVTDSTCFNVTVENSEDSPTYVTLSTIDVVVGNETFSDIPVIPNLPYELHRNQSVPLRCSWNWTNHREKNVTITVCTLQDFTISSTKVTPAPVILEITEVQFSPVNIASLNLTVRNSGISLSNVNITYITVTVDDGTPENITDTIPSLPYLLHVNESKTFVCTWNWGDYGGMNVTFTAYAMVYSASITKLVPEPIIVITDVVFDPAEPTYFNVTVKNPPLSPTVANVTNITMTVEDGTPENITDTNPSLPYLLHVNESKTFVCTWNWGDYGGMNVTFTAYAMVYSASITKLVPEPIIVITDVVFDPAEPTYFNVTVKNPPLSPTVANVTNITMTVEDGTPENITETSPPLPLELIYTEDTFTCLWNWTDHLGKKAVISVATLPGYIATYTQQIPVIALINITNVVFNITDTNPYFNVTVLNPESSLLYAELRFITVTLEDGTVQNVTVVGPPYLPHILHRNQSVTFVCFWNWTNYQGLNITIGVHSSSGYVARLTRNVPLLAFIEITDVLFNAANTTCFNITVLNPEDSLIHAYISRITVTMENGSVQEMTLVIPSLPNRLDSNTSVTFECSWNWTDHRGESVTITVYTLEGYKVSILYTTPSSIFALDTVQSKRFQKRV